jgi:hypothetical protein
MLRENKIPPMTRSCQHIRRRRRQELKLKRDHNFQAELEEGMQVKNVRVGAARGGEECMG